MSRRNGRRNDRPDGAGDMYGDFYNNPNRNRKTLYERMHIRMLTEIATNRFKWEGLPEEIDHRFLELMLFRQALSVFFWDNEYSRYFALRGSGQGKWNMYDNPITFQVIGNTMINRQLKATDCVPIWANTLRSPAWDVVYLQATKLAKVERTIEINLQAMQKPFLFAVDDNQRQTFVNVWRQMQEDTPVIFGTETMLHSLEEQIKLFDLNIDKDLVLNLQISKAKMWAETMTLLGVNNANQEKRERLVADEVSANDDQILAVRNSELGARQYACEQINKKYGLSVWCEWNETVPLGNMGDALENTGSPREGG